MKFICDVHIPIKLVKYLNKSGFEALHVNTLPNSYYSKDAEITEFADRHGMILISKDADFKNSFLLNRTPKKLIKINLGNITNDNLILLINQKLELIEKLDVNSHFLLELGGNQDTFIL